MYMIIKTSDSSIYPFNELKFSVQSTYLFFSNFIGYTVNVKVRFPHELVRPDGIALWALLKSLRNQCIKRYLHGHFFPVEHLIFGNRSLGLYWKDKKEIVRIHEWMDRLRQCVAFSQIGHYSKSWVPSFGFSIVQCVPERKSSIANQCNSVFIVSKLFFFLFFFNCFLLWKSYFGLIFSVLEMYVFEFRLFEIAYYNLSHPVIYHMLTVERYFLPYPKKATLSKWYSN